MPFDDALSRRALVAGVAGIVSASAVSACGGDEPSARRSATPVTPDHTAGPDDWDTLSARLRSAAPGTTVTLPERTYRISKPLAVPAGITLAGAGIATTIVPRSRVSRLVVMEGEGAAVDNITLRGLDLVPNALLYVANGSSGVRINACTFTNAARTLYALQSTGDSPSLTITGNTFRQVSSAMRVHGSHSNLTIDNNAIDDWRYRGIEVLAGATSMSFVSVSRNRVTGLLPGGRARYPVVITGQRGQPITDLLVEGNTVIGANRGYRQEGRPGTADQIAVRLCDQVQVVRNESRLGGDMGITVAFCNDATVAENRCFDNDTAGIYVGAEQTGETSNVTVRDNVCQGNGRNRNGDRVYTAEIKLVRASGVVVENNDLSRSKADTTGGDVPPVRVQYSTDVSIASNDLGGRPPSSILVTDGFDVHVRQS